MATKGKQQRRRPAKHLLELRVTGPDIHAGGIPIPELLVLCQHVQSAVERQAEALEGRRTLRPGPTIQKVVAECTLELVSLGRGSAVLGFDPASHDRHLPAIRTRALAAINGVVESIDAIAKGKDTNIDPGVLDSLNGLGGLFAKRVKAVEWSAAALPGKRRLHATFNPAVYKKVERRLRPPTTRPVSVDGVLEMADFKPGDYKCRLHPTLGPPVTCTFGPELADQVYSILRQVAHVEGRGTVNAHTDKLESVDLKTVQPLNPLDVNAGSFFTGWTFDQLVQMQSIDPLRDPKALSGGWPEDEEVDEVLNEIYQRRQ
jgi:hypothetical protein